MHRPEELIAYRLSNAAGTTVSILNLGLTVTSVKVPISDGAFRELCLGFRNISRYLDAGYLDNYPFLGTVIGPYANRIRHASFILDGSRYDTPANDGLHTLHSGDTGLDKHYWKPAACDEPSSLAFETERSHLQDGFPGQVHYRALIRLRDDNTLCFTFHADADRATPINLTQHSYFNLDGPATRIFGHRISLYADRFMAQHGDLTTTGELLGNGTAYQSFEDGRLLLSDAELMAGQDRTFVLNQEPDADGLKLAGEAIGSDSAVRMRVYTDASCIHFYTGQMMPDLRFPGEEPLIPFAGFCMECQDPTDGIHYPGLIRDTVLRPGVNFVRRINYQFDVL